MVLDLTGQGAALPLAVSTSAPREAAPADPMRPEPYCIVLCEHTSRTLARLEATVSRGRLEQLLSELLTQELGDRRRTPLLTLLLHRVAGEACIGDQRGGTPTTTCQERSR